MRPVIDFNQSFHRNVRVNLRRGKPRVSEKFLDVAQIRAGIEQMCGEGMTQTMRRNIAVDFRAEFNVFINHSPDAASRDARALVV